MVKLSLLLVACLGLACSQALAGGTPVVQTRTVPAFSRLSVAGPFTVEVGLGAAQSVRFRCEDEVLRHVKSDVTDGALQVRFEEGYDPPSRVNCAVDIAAPALKGVNLAGSGHVRVRGLADGMEKMTVTGSGTLAVDDVKAESVSAIISGSGQMDVHGHTNKLSVRCTGSGDVRAQGLAATEADVNVTGSGDVRVAVSEAIDANVTGAGKVAVKGSPKTRRERITGSGKVTYAP
jgi:hypothetical protein